MVPQNNLHLGPPRNSKLIHFFPGILKLKLKLKVKPKVNPKYKLKPNLELKLELKLKLKLKLELKLKLKLKLALRRRGSDRHGRTPFLDPIRHSTAIDVEDKLDDAIDATELAAVGLVCGDDLAVVDVKRLVHQGRQQGRGLSRFHVVPERVAQANHPAVLRRLAFVAPTRTGEGAGVVATVGAVCRGRTVRGPEPPVPRARRRSGGLAR